MTSDRQRGFSILEILVAMGLTAMLLTLAAGALRNYWLAHSLDGAQDELIAQVRERQEKAVSESHPLVFGLRLLEGSSQWGVVEYVPDDPSTTGTDEESCVQTALLTFGTGVQVSSASFAASAEATFCSTVFADASDYVFFYPRGTATAGTMTLLQPITNRTRVVTVSPITGRVQGA